MKASGYENCSISDRKALQRVGKTAQCTTSSPLHTIKTVENRPCLRRACSIARDSSHPGHRLFILLPSRRRYRSLCCRTSKFSNSFFTSFVTLL